MPFVGSRFPESLDLTVNTTGGVDLSGVVSADFAVSSPSGKALAWAWTTSSPTAASVHAIHTFAPDGNDATAAGEYTVSGWLVTALTRYRIKSLRINFERYP